MVLLMVEFLTKKCEKSYFSDAKTQQTGCRAWQKAKARPVQHNKPPLTFNTVATSLLHIYTVLLSNF